MPAQKDKKTGRFTRVIKQWTPDSWNDGFLNNRGRFIVYSPNSKYVLYQGYALRYYVVWELFSNISISNGHIIHHKNGDKTDDRFDNLELMTKVDHDAMHEFRRRNGKYFICICCGDEFYKPQWRLNRGHTGLFCSHECYSKMGGRWYKRRNSL